MRLSGPESEFRPLTVIPGTFAVALLLFGTRWGSYIGHFPIFLTDVLIALAVGRLLFSRSRSVGSLGTVRMGLTAWAVTGFLLFVIARALLGTQALSMVWLRDLTPFLYAGLVLVGATAYARTGPRGRVLTARVLWWALNGHLVWTLMVNFGVIAPESMPFLPASDVTIFSQRPDVDMAVLGMTAALYLRHLMVGRHRSLAALGLVLCLVAVSGLESRAGLLAVLAALTTSYLLTLSAQHHARSRLKWIVLAPVVLLVAATVVPQTEAGQRLLASAGVIEATEQHEIDAIGTAHARDLAWDYVIDWTNDDTVRTLVGTGFGPNFIRESGAEPSLSGTAWEGVRSPHNWFIGVYARTGIIGLSFIALILLGTLYHAVRIRRSVGATDLLTLAAAGSAALLVVAAFGVVLESPFGAVPFWWFLGLLFAERHVGPTLQEDPEMTSSGVPQGGLPPVHLTP
ncbi:Lipid A core - O-antigen ligase and related enzymes [Kocuria rosea]|nr:Lipid A core - O-antigen ligase and related enzymes [Kocuria rosea]